MNSNRNLDNNRLNVNGNNWNGNNNGYAFGMALALTRTFILMKTYKNFYSEIISLKNLVLAWRKARKHKTKKDYVIAFEKNFRENILKLHEELKNQTYKPKPLKTFILRDPKTRKISKSAFRDRIIHHALIRIIEPIFEKIFIYDSCANRIGKGNLFALKRFELFKRKVTNNLKSEAFCLKADIRPYFQEVNHKILLEIISRKMKDERTIWLIKQILNNLPASQIRGANEGWNASRKLNFSILRKCLP